MSGPLLLVGGAEWRDGCTFDAEALQAAGNPEVLVLPTAAAYEHPERAVEWAQKWFQGLGGRARGLDVLRRFDAERQDLADEVRSARFVYLSGGSPMHLRSVLKDSPVWDALAAAWEAGATVAGSSAGAMVLTDPMVDPRGGAFTLGLGLCRGLTVVPHFDAWSEEKSRRTLELAPAGLPVVGIDERTALIRAPEGTWLSAGAGRVEIYVDGKEADLTRLPS